MLLTITVFPEINQLTPEYLKKKYPSGVDCIVLDQQIAEIKKNIDEVAKARLKKYGDYIVNKNVQDKLSNLVKNLQILLKDKENAFSIADCRNKIEVKRVDESANLFSTVSAKNETNVINDTKKKQLVLIGSGSLILIIALIVILKKK